MLLNISHFCVCVIVFVREMLVCRCSAVTSRGPSSVTSNDASIKSLCMTWSCSLQTVASPGQTLSGQLWSPETSFHGWTVRVKQQCTIKWPVRGHTVNREIVALYMASRKLLSDVKLSLLINQYRHPSIPHWVIHWLWVIPCVPY